MGPVVSRRSEAGKIPCVDTNPRVGRILYSAARFAGVTMEPSVSVPIASGEYPAETPTALPVEDPPGLYEYLSSAKITQAIRLSPTE